MSLPPQSSMKVRSLVRFIQITDSPIKIKIMNRFSFSRLFAIMIMIMAVISCTDISLGIPSVNDGRTENKGDNSQDEPEELSYVRKTIKLKGSVAVSSKFVGYATSSASVYVVMPYPESNEYQNITSKTLEGNLSETVAGTKIIYKSEKYSRGTNVDIACEYVVDYVTYSIVVDFNRIKEIYQYDTESDIYKNYLGSTGEYIVPTNPEIVSIASSLWKDSKNILDYARRCYEFTAANYRYLNPYTGLHTLEENLKNGGGDCGNLSAIYMSLLRNKEIPARPVVCIKPDGSFHVWSEFYLEGYGWIPVDVTYKNSNRGGNYFGVYLGDCIVVSNEYDVLLKDGSENFYLPILQTYAYWYWNMSGVKFTYNIRG